MRTLFLMGTLYVCLVFSQRARGQSVQFLDSFSSDRLTSNPWLGDTSKFIIDQKRLRSNSQVVNDLFYISHALFPDSSMLWEVDIDLEFSTSSVNYVDLVLHCQRRDLLMDSAQVFVRIGGSRDKLALYSISNTGELTEWLTSSERITHQFDSKVVIRYHKTQGWYMAFEEGNAWTQLRLQEGPELTDQLGYAGIRIQQSVASFHGKHLFDNYFAGATPVDTVPPTITRLEVVDPYHLNVYFNEELDNTMEKTSFCSINTKQCNFRVVKDRLEIAPANALTTGVHQLKVHGVLDTTGNLTSITHQFDYVHVQQAEQGDVVISEIMADPEPTIALPNHEYVEIYNRSDKIIDLANWELTDGTRKAILPEFLLWPDSFVVLTNKPWPGINNTLTLVGFPSLNNDGDDLTLSNASEHVIENIKYSVDWHTEVWKKGGGWSLEKVDLVLRCATEYNWQSAQDAGGGSPGRFNSIAIRDYDITPPRLRYWNVIDDTTIRLEFDEVISNASIVDFELDAFDVKRVVHDDLKVLILQLDGSLEKDKTYELQFGNVSDCYGNQMSETQLDVAIPIAPEPGDILLNEILFNPLPFGVDFLEVVNVSEHILNLRSMGLGVLDNTGELLDILTPTVPSKPIFPNGITCLTTDCSVLGQQYPQFDSSHCVELEQLPTYGDKEGAAVLYRIDGVELDRLSYHESWHHPMLESIEGVSLERITLHGETQTKENWSSASQFVGFATPGNVNSQQVGEIELTDSWQLINDPVTPNSDGHADVFLVQFDQQVTDAVVDLRIYDRFGKLVAEPVNSTLVGTRNMFTWSCTDDKGDLVPPDIYIVLLEVVQPNGSVQRYKRGFTIYY